MLTPAEELGLSGLSLASQVRKAFYQMPAPAVVELVRSLHAEALRRRLIYQRDGRDEAVHVLPCPLTVLPDQLAYLHSVTLTLLNALKRLPDLYLSDFAVREALRLTPPEEEWLWKCWDPSHRENNPVFGRLDAVIDFTAPMWKDTLRFMEPNLSGIGGLHLVPTCEQLVADLVVPGLRRQDPELTLEVGKDIRELLIQEILDHLEAIGRPGRTLCFVEPKYAGSGPDEQEALARYFHDRHGLKVLHADPAELRLEGGEVCYDGAVIDLAYRDYAVYDLVALEGEGADVEPLRVLFRENRVVSSVAAELDQKSCWEVLTDPQLAQRHFSADERQVFRRHVLWTRILSDRRTTLPDGGTDDLLSFVREARESLVLKPNRGYGGQGVAIGPSLTQAEWEQVLERALADKERWVAQSLANIPVCPFPVVGPDGAVHLEPFYTVMGFAPTRYGLSILGRASQKQVVNVAQRGGLCAVLLGRPRARLHGPQALPESAP